MNRIDEIKERYGSKRVEMNHYMGVVRNNDTEDWVAEFSKEEDAEKFISVYDDVQYLLAKLEMAENAMSDARGSVGIISTHGQFDTDKKREALETLEKALAAIRS